MKAIITLTQEAGTDKGGMDYMLILSMSTMDEGEISEVYMRFAIIDALNHLPTTNGHDIWIEPGRRIRGRVDEVFCRDFGINIGQFIDKAINLTGDDGNWSRNKKTKLWSCNVEIYRDGNAD